MKKLFDWLDDRSGYRRVLAGALNEEVPGGASFAYVFGSVLTFILVLQMTTGVFLAMYYSPSATDAWASVAYIQDTVTMGWFIRGLHSYGASAMVIVAGLHLMQTAVYGAYKAPRELNWIVGVLMLGLILAFALTGYLLPWDQTGYWATKVATGIAGTSPVIGEQLQHAVQAGNEYGNLTLTRFFAIHVFILPGALIGLVVIHIALFRKHGVTPKWDRSDEDLRKNTQPFWPDQMFKDMVAMAVVFAILVGVNVATHGVKLDAPADPSSNFDARPEWYFRALFQVLKYFEGWMEHVVSLGTPVVVGAVLLGLPFADRGDSRNPRKRIKFLAVLGAGAIGVGALTMISFREDAADPKMQERLAEARVMSAKARALAKQYGVPPAGGVAIYTMEPTYQVKKLWSDHCAACHVGDEREGPEIVEGYNSRPWIKSFLLDPSGSKFFGVTKINEMEPVELSGVDLDAIVELIYAQTGDPKVDSALVDKGKTLFEENCIDCHDSLGEEATGSAPQIDGRGTVDWFADLIKDAGGKRFFDEYNEMPLFGRAKLSEDERYQLAEYLYGLRTGSYTPPPIEAKPPGPDDSGDGESGDDSGDAEDGAASPDDASKDGASPDDGAAPDDAPEN